jgi:pimeloyl-ACP methyl ester carboxylesterase
MTDNPGDRREIMVQVWYPAQLPVKASSAAAYFPDVELLTTAYSDSRRATLASVRSHAFADARIALTQKPFPVVVLSPGASTSTFYYSSMIEELVSHGYIVAGINHPYESVGVVFPDKRVAEYDEDQVKDVLPFLRQRIEVRAADASFVVEQLTKLNTTSSVFRGRIDLTRIGIFGHSRGGLAAAMACQHDRRFKACLNMDGGTLGGPFYVDTTPPTQPFMWFIRFKPEPSDEQLKTWNMTREMWNQYRDRVHSRVNGFFRSVKGGSYRVTLNGATHLSFSDNPLLASDRLDDLAFRLRVARIVRDWTLAFFDTHLKNHPSQLLRGALTNYPEVTVERFEPHPNR